MKSTTAALLVVLLFSSQAGCYRTRYVNLRELGTAPPAPAAQPEPLSRWQHFFVWGWFPVVREIDAGRACGGADQVEAIETRRTFLQGLVSVVASFYVNIYSPYNGEVVCKGAIRR